MLSINYAGIVVGMAKSLIVIAFFLSCSFSCLASDAPVVAIAANMTNVMSTIIDKYQNLTGKHIRVSYGSSGNFTRQLLQGAPYELFLTADKKYADILNEKQGIVTTSRPYALGRIAFFVPEQSSLAKSTDLEQIVDGLQFTRYRRIAIANPEHAPYGIAAQQALQQAGVWTILRKRLLLAENAAQTAQFAISGGIDLAVLPYSFAQEPAISSQGKFFVIPEVWHEPIEQYLILTTRAGPEAADFYQYLFSHEIGKILNTYGYSLLRSQTEH